MLREDVIYLAGLFDGEGCVQVKRYKEKKKKHHSKNTTICIDCLPKSETKTVYLSAALLLAIVFLSLYLFSFDLGASLP